MKLSAIISNFVHKAKQEATQHFNQAPILEKNRSPSATEEKKCAGKGWIGMDLDGTLAHMDLQSGVSTIGDPVPQMVELAIRLINEGNRVKIFTARASDAIQIAMIQKWLRDNGLPDLEITNVKDFDMIRLYDDRAVQVITNTGKLVEL